MVNKNESTESISRLLTVKETAKILRIKPSTLTHWRCVKRYNLKFVKIGRRVMYRPKDVNEFIKSRTVGA